MRGYMKLSAFHLGLGMLINGRYSSRVCRLSGQNECLLIDVNDPSERTTIRDYARSLGLKAEYVAGTEWYGNRGGVRIAVYGLEE